MAHGSQKRACPPGTNAKPARGATRHTSSQQSSEVDATDDSDAVNGQFSDFYSAAIIRQGLFSPSVQPLFDLVLKLHGLALSGLAMSVPTILMVSRCPPLLHGLTLSSFEMSGLSISAVLCRYIFLSGT